MKNKEYQIAVVLTCFNRRDLTLKALGEMYRSAEAYNSSADEKVCLSVFLTDDGCTDGTADAVREHFADKKVTILQGDGNLYWTGGMRLAWNEALKERGRWDFYLLMNDDTFFLDNTFTELLALHHYAEKNGKPGVYSAVCKSLDGKEITYGGKTYNNRFIGRSVTLQPNGKPQPCMMTNANALLVTREVVDTIGIFGKEYVHSCADWAYGIDANKAGFSVLITAEACALCDNDHDSEKDQSAKVMSMTVSQRKAFFAHPLRGANDMMIFMKRYQKVKYCMLYVARLLSIYMPSVYYGILKRRPS